MASQIDSSFATESVDASNTSTLARKISINIKEHLRELPDEEKRDLKGKLCYGCNYCEHISSGSSGIRYHLKHLHQIDVDTAPKARQKEELSNITALYAQLVEKNATPELDQAVLQRMIEKKMVDEALLNLIIVRRLPFRMVEWPEFRNFCITLNPESPAHIPQNHSTITNRISKYFPRHKIFAVAARPIKFPFQTHTELEDAFELRTTLCASSRIIKATALNEHRMI
jgi:hypothetical protein